MRVWSGRAAVLTPCVLGWAAGLLHLFHVGVAVLLFCTLEWPCCWIQWVLRWSCNAVVSRCMLLWRCCCTDSLRFAATVLLCEYLLNDVLRCAAVLTQVHVGVACCCCCSMHVGMTMLLRSHSMHVGVALLLHLLVACCGAAVLLILAQRMLR